MKVDKAIEKIKYMPVKLFDDEADEAKRMAIQALEKQIAKKPIIDRMDFSEGQWASHFKCPNCEEIMVCMDETGWYGGKCSRFCPDCGQKIDWKP